MQLQIFIFVFLTLISSFIPDPPIVIVMLRTDLLGYLGEDIFYLILEMVCRIFQGDSSPILISFQMSESHRSSLLSMSLVCKGWHQQVQPFIDRHVEIITSPEPGHHSTLMDRLQDQSFWAKIKSISIWPGLEEDFLPENSQIITTLQGLLPELHLVSFRFVNSQSLSTILIGTSIVGITGHQCL